MNHNIFSAYLLYFSATLIRFRDCKYVRMIKPLGPYLPTPDNNMCVCSAGEIRFHLDKYRGDL